MHCVQVRPSPSVPATHSKVKHKQFEFLKNDYNLKHRSIKSYKYKGDLI